MSTMQVESISTTFKDYQVSIDILESIYGSNEPPLYSLQISFSSPHVSPMFKISFDIDMSCSPSRFVEELERDFNECFEKTQEENGYLFNNIRISEDGERAIFSNYNNSFYIEFTKEEADELISKLNGIKQEADALVEKWENKRNEVIEQAKANKPMEIEQEVAAFAKKIFALCEAGYSREEIVQKVLSDEKFGACMEPHWSYKYANELE